MKSCYIITKCFSNTRKIYTINGVPLKVPTDLQNKIKSLFKNMIGLKKRGTDLFFTDIDK